MKNYKNKLGYALCILCVCVLISCGTESVQISKEEPFIVAKITLKNGMYKYEREKFERPVKELFAMKKQSITVDYNLNLQVGDTLRMYALDAAMRCDRRELRMRCGYASDADKLVETLN